VAGTKINKRRHPLTKAARLTGGPVIRIRLVSIMGGTGIKRGRKLSKEERKRQQELREAESRGEVDA
jgi:hypothetical protein